MSSLPVVALLSFAALVAACSQASPEDSSSAAVTGAPEQQQSEEAEGNQKALVATYLAAPLAQFSNFDESKLSGDAKLDDDAFHAGACVKDGSVTVHAHRWAVTTGQFKGRTLVVLNAYEPARTEALTPYYAIYDEHGGSLVAMAARNPTYEGVGAYAKLDPLTYRTTIQACQWAA